jgi:hypothetical protein
MRDREGRPAGEEVVGSAPAFGSPVGTVMPTMQSASFDVYADGAEPLGRRSIEIEAAEPPANTIEIDSPELVLTDLAIPRPFVTDDAAEQ